MAIIIYLQRPMKRNDNPFQMCFQPWRCTCRCRRPWFRAGSAMPYRRLVSSPLGRFQQVPYPAQMNMNQFSSTSQTIFSRKKKKWVQEGKTKKFKQVKLRDELNVIQVETFFGPSVSLACVIITTTTKYTHTAEGSSWWRAWENKTKQKPT